MNKRVLYITISTNDSNTLGYRHSNILKYISEFFIIDLLNFEFTKRKYTIFKKILNRLYIYPDRFFFNLIYYKKQIRKRLIQNHYDLIIIGVHPFSFLSLATFTKKQQPDLHVIVDMTDPLTANVSYIDDFYIHEKFIGWYEKKHFQNIDTLIVLNEEIKEFYKKKYYSLKKIIVLEQGTDPSVSLESKEKNNNKLELIYAGIFYEKIREPYKLYEAINIFSGEIRLSVFGGLKKVFLPPLNERFYFGSRITKELANKKTNEADIIVFIDNYKGIQIPGKLFDCLATKKPILFIYENEHSPTLKYLKEYKGIFYTKNDSDQIVEKLNEISLNIKKKYSRDISKYYWENLVKYRLIPNLFLEY